MTDLQHTPNDLYLPPNFRLDKDYSADEEETSGEEESPPESRIVERAKIRNTQRDKDRTRNDDSIHFGSHRVPVAAANLTTQSLVAVVAKQPVKQIQQDGSQSAATRRMARRSHLHKKLGIHPNTSFDTTSALETALPLDSDTEADISDIRRAQRMSLNVSTIHSTPQSHRCVRQILRGEYDKLQKEAELGIRRQRMYLVATDLSDEAAYALEWTIGTVLRDGDTLLAVYAVDRDLGTNGERVGIDIGAGAALMSDTAKVVHDLSKEQKASEKAVQGPPSAAANAEAEHGSPEFDRMDKMEQERWRATQEIGDRCIKLLRKTRLQIRAVVEVFHCKSPRHMITEVIDYLEPTLVILGSRGRSALKGVLLGSFSNYLVTKSSVPVMVARKKLRKHSKYHQTIPRLSNNLMSPRRLELAKID